MKNIERKGEIARHEQFLLFPHCFYFYCFDKIPFILMTCEIVVCQHFKFEKKSKICRLTTVRCRRPTGACEISHSYDPIAVQSNGIPLYFELCSSIIRLLLSRARSQWCTKGVGPCSLTSQVQGSISQCVESTAALA